MKKAIIIIVVNLIILGIIAGTYKKYNNVTDSTIRPDSVPENNYQTTDLTIITEQGMSPSVMFEVKDAISYFTPEILKAFNDTGWKVMVVTDIDFSDSQYEGTSPDEPDMTVGFTNFNTKIIQIKDIKTEGFIKLRLLHEMCHFVDTYYADASDTDEFDKLFRTIGTNYIESQYAGISKTEEKAKDLEYASSSKIEFFACSAKDYFYEPEYLETNYKALYSYYQNLIGKYEE